MTDAGLALVLTTAQMRAADQYAIRELGVPGLVLMENAGRGIAEVVVRALAERGQSIKGAKVAVVCGVGNNGGDGFVIARHLRLAGADVGVGLALPRAKLTGDSATNARVWERMGGANQDLSDASALAWSDFVADAAVTVDSIFGTGLRDDVRGVPALAIAALNASRALRVAVDIPSGLDGDSGRVCGVAVNADVTATVGARKLGLVLDATAGIGRLEVVSLGVPIHAPPEGGPYAYFVTEAPVRSWLPRAAPDAHKNTRGHVLVVAGSAGKTGAALLTARASLRAGAGLVTVASTAAGQVALDAKLVEAMSVAYTPGDDADADTFDQIVAASQGKRAVALGPGVPTGPAMRTVVQRLAAELPLPMVIDADGLNHLAGDLAVTTRGASAARILTPHPGEAARLLGLPAAALAADRLPHARQLARESQAVVVLKGARTLVATPDGTVFVNPAANPALATAGSGDVLTGVIAGLLARGMPAVQAAVAGVFFHGQAAARAIETLGSAHLIAGDLPEAVARELDPA